MHERIPKKTTHHTKALLYITNSCFYRSQEEISQAIALQNGKLQKVLTDLSNKKIILQQGCLYKRKKAEEIEGMI